MTPIDPVEPLDANLRRLLAGADDDLSDAMLGVARLPDAVAARMRFAIDRGLAIHRRARVRRRVTVAVCAAALVVGALGLRPSTPASRTGRFTVEAGESIRIDRDAVVSAVSSTLLDVETAEGGFRIGMPSGSALFDVRQRGPSFRVHTPAGDVKSAKGTSARFVLQCVARTDGPADRGTKGQVFAIVLDGTLQFDLVGGGTMSIEGGEMITATEDGASERMKMADLPRLRARLAKEEASNATLRSRMLALEAEASRRHVRGFPRFPPLHPPGATEANAPETLDEVDWVRAARAAIAIAEATDDSSARDDARAEFAVLAVSLVGLRTQLADVGLPGEELLHPDALPRLVVAILRELSPAPAADVATIVAEEAKDIAARARERRVTNPPPLARARNDLLTDEEICELVSRFAPSARADLAWRLPPFAAAHLDVSPRVVTLRSREELAEAFYSAWRSGAIEFVAEQDIRVHLRATRAAEGLADLLERTRAEHGADAVTRMIEWLSIRQPSPDAPSASPESAGVSRRLWREIIELQSVHEAAFLALLTPAQRARYEASGPAVIVATLDE